MTASPPAIRAPAMPATVKALPPGGLTLAEVTAWLQDNGYRAKVVKGDDGKDHVQSGAQGWSFDVWLYDCKDDRCEAIQLSAGWTTKKKFDKSRMNEWNRDQQWCRGYYDKEEDPWVEMDIDLSPGGTYELIDDQLSIYNNCISDFDKKYNITELMK